MLCQKCKKDFSKNEEIKLEESHDIPKYMVGSDEDGRHILCVECHSLYDRIILARCFIFVFHLLILYSEDRRDYIPFANFIKKSSDMDKAKCFAIAKDVNDEFFSFGASASRSVKREGVKDGRR